jgi:hypothetical protein
MMVRAIGRLGNLAAPTKHSGRDRPCAIMVGLICGEGDSLWRFFYRQVSNVSAGRGVRAFGEFEDDIRAGRFGFNWFGLRSVAVLRKPDHAVARNDSIDGCAGESETRANFAERFASDQCLSDWVDNVQSVYRAAGGSSSFTFRFRRAASDIRQPQPDANQDLADAGPFGQGVSCVRDGIRPPLCEIVGMAFARKRRPCATTARRSTVDRDVP